MFNSKCWAFENMDLTFYSPLPISGRGVENHQGAFSLPEFFVFVMTYTILDVVLNAVESG